jgi:AraC family transcriptional regulator
MADIMFTNSTSTGLAHTGFNDAFASTPRSKRPPSYEMTRPGPREISVVSKASRVEISPANLVRRQTLDGQGVAAEIVQTTSHAKIEFRFCAPLHLLAVYERGFRREGETFVEGLPRSNLRNFTGKISFIPAGHEYREWHEPGSPTRLMYIYFDPRMLWLPGLGSPRLLFEDAALRNTALKLQTLIEDPAADDEPYLKALGTVLAFELMRLSRGRPRSRSRMQGGLASWQQRIVNTHIEEHLSEQISLATLAQLVSLSPYYFCRAFKQSFGVPPHRYHVTRRIERAKMLLTNPELSVTEIGLRVGFSDTSSFTAAFRKMTGITPTAYHRTLT